MGDRRHAYRNAEREVIFSETVDRRQILRNGQLYRHRFSAVLLCSRAKTIQHGREWLRSYSQGSGPLAGRRWKKGETGKKEGKWNRRWGYVKGNSRIGGI